MSNDYFGLFHCFERLLDCVIYRLDAELFGLTHCLSSFVTFFVVLGQGWQLSVLVLRRVELVPGLDSQGDSPNLLDSFCETEFSLERFFLIHFGCFAVGNFII